MGVARAVAGGRNLTQFFKFGMVGASGAVVQLVVYSLLLKLGLYGFGVTEHDVVFPIPFTEFNVRWYNVFTALGFLAANTTNYQLNRMWTFKESTKVSWWRGFFPFLLTGLGAFVIQQFVLVLLMNPTSPIGLPSDLLDDSSGLRRKSYWATLIAIIVATPVNFVINKLWTFRSAPDPQKAAVVEEAQPA